MGVNGIRGAEKSISIPYPLLGGHAARRLAQPLDSLLDGSKRLQAGFDRNGGRILQHFDGNGIAQGIEIVDQLSAACREKKPVGTPILRVVPPLQKAVLDQTIEQAHQRDRLEFKYVGQIDLRQPLLLPQSIQNDPLRARRTAAFGAMLDIIAQQA
jgi:hypothetical protein